MASTKEQRQKWGLFPSRDVDVKKAFELLDWSWYRFARSTEKLDVELIRAVIDAMPAWVESPARTPYQTDHRRCALRFVAASVEVSEDDDALKLQWRACVNALKAFESQYPLGSTKKAALLRAIAASPRLLEGTRAAAVTCTTVPTEMLAVLVIDGTPESADAPIPHVHRAMEAPERLAQLENLVRFATNATMKELLAAVERKIADERGSSQTLALARKLGLTTSRRFRVSVTVKGTNELLLQFDLDSERPGPALRGWFSQAGGKGLELQHVALEELPSFVSRLAGERRGAWQWADATAYPLKGKRLATFLSWLSNP